MIIYTSGTTGKPKGAVHTHCGFPVKAAQDMAFGTDVHRGRCDLLDDRHGLDDGTLAGLWRVDCLAQPSSFTMARPDFPGHDRLWELVEKHKVTQLGVSPTLIRSLIPMATISSRSMTCPRCAVLPPRASRGIPIRGCGCSRRSAKAKRPIINYSGGTEICGGIVMGNPLLPLKPCAFSAAVPRHGRRCGG